MDFVAVVIAARGFACICLCCQRVERARQVQGLFRGTRLVWKTVKKSLDDRASRVHFSGSLAIRSSGFWIPGRARISKIRSGTAGIGPFGPGVRVLIFIGRVGDFAPGLAGRGGEPLRPPFGCPSERAQF